MQIVMMIMIMTPAKSDQYPEYLENMMIMIMIMIMIMMIMIMIMMIMIMIMMIMIKFSGIEWGEKQ